jgi:hypothetical protein
MSDGCFSHAAREDDSDQCDCDGYGTNEYASVAAPAWRGTRFDLHLRMHCVRSSAAGDSARVNSPARRDADDRRNRGEKARASTPADSGVHLRRCVARRSRAARFWAGTSMPASSSSPRARLSGRRRAYGGCERSASGSGRSANCRKCGEWYGSGRGACSGTSHTITSGAGALPGVESVDEHVSVGEDGTAGPV